MPTLNRQFFQGLIEDKPSSQWGDIEPLSAQFNPEWKQGQIEYAKSMLTLLNTYGVDDLTQLPDTIKNQLPNQGVYTSTGGGSVFKQFVNFVTSPAFLIAAGGVAGVFAGGAGAAAGAGSGGGGAATGAGLSAELAAGAPELAGAYGGTATAGAGAAGGAGTGVTLADTAWGVNPQSASLGGGLTATASEGGLSAGLAAPTAEGAMGAGALGGGITSGAGGTTGIGAGTAAGTASTTGGLGGLMTGAGQVAGAMPWGNLAGAVLEYMGSQKAGQTAENLMQQQMESDQWRGQQGRYFEPLYEAATRGIGDTDYGRSIAESTARKMASQGYDMSGNMPMEIAKSLQGGTTDYLRAVGPLAMGRGESQAPGQFAPAMMGAAQAPYGIAGYGLDQIIKNWPSGGGGSQPSSSLGSGGSFQNYQPTDYQNIFL
jgi:hypothetical protein